MILGGSIAVRNYQIPKKKKRSLRFHLSLRCHSRAVAMPILKPEADIWPLDLLEPIEPVDSNPIDFLACKYLSNLPYLQRS